MTRADDDTLVHDGVNAAPVPDLPPFAQRAFAILWPAFLMAGVLEMLVFAFVDPRDLHWLGGATLELSRQGVYTLTFFLFWFIVSIAGALSSLLSQPADRVNDPRPYRRFP
jgi:hypothetical protein